jgi:hypothetical protein
VAVEVGIGFAPEGKSSHHQLAATLPGEDFDDASSADILGSHGVGEMIQSDLNMNANRVERSSDCGMVEAVMKKLAPSLSLGS